MTSSRSRSRSSTARPMRVDSTSPPRRRRLSSTPVARASTCSAVTGRFLAAAFTPATTLSRSKGWRSPVLLTTISGASSTRSKVVNRCPQVRHSRRRRMAVPSSDARESTTLSSGAEQSGQRTGSKLPGAPRGTGAEPGGTSGVERDPDLIAHLDRRGAPVGHHGLDHRADVALGVDLAGQAPEGVAGSGLDLDGGALDRRRGGVAQPAATPESAWASWMATTSRVTTTRAATMRRRR